MTLKGKRCLFMVQGEGRGHMTQSIAMKHIIEQEGMELSAVMIGKSERREIPAFYPPKIGAPIIQMESPNFTTDKSGKSIKTLPSMMTTIHNVPHYIESLKLIDRTMKELQPDLVINFYEPLCGFHYWLHKPKVPMVSVAHQYLFLHKDFETPHEDPLAERTLKLYTRLTSAHAARKLALSFYPFSNMERRGVYTVPPLLREEVQQQQPTNGNYFLVYLLNSGYMEDIIAWHKKNLQVELHCFTDKKDIDDVQKYDDTLFFHKINDKKFLELMAGSKGLITTAGFESVCEAMYLGKPVFMVPVKGHYEQLCNSRDAAKAGAGIYDDAFNIDKFMDFVKTYNRDRNEFRNWADQSQQLIIKNLEAAITEKTKRQRRRKSDLALSN